MNPDRYRVAERRRDFSVEEIRTCASGGQRRTQLRSRVTTFACKREGRDEEIKFGIFEKRINTRKIIINY